MNSKVYKWCVVPQCGNSSIKTPNKLFVYVPNNKTTRYKWLNLARRDPKAINLKSPIYICEDHFDLPNDMDNYMEYHLMGSVSQVRMKPGCIPKKFQCQADRRKRTSDTTERPYIQKKQRRILIEECIKDREAKSVIKNPLELGETSSGSAEVVMASPMQPAGLASPTLPEGKLTSIELVGGIFCGICQSTFTNKKDYDSHYETHDTGDAGIGYTCVVCRKQFPGYPSFRNHCYLSHVAKNKHKCKHCSRAFSKLSLLNGHINTTHNFKCDPCQKQFASIKELNTHQVIHGRDKPPYNCQECGETIESIDMCEFHIDEHCSALYSCPICNDETTYNKKDAAKHLTKHFGEVLIDKPVSDYKIGEDCSIDILGGVLCNYCDELFKNRIEFDTHFGIEHGDQPLIYSCNICRKQYDKYLLFAEHCYNHMTKGRFECTDCGKTFPRLSLLVTHSEFYHLSDSVEKPFLCGECGRGFKNPNRLRQHTRVVHKTDNMRCNEAGCDMLFSSLKALLLHQRSHRSAHDNWCRHCGLQFSSLESCARHLDVHRKKHYVCPVCRRSYKEKHLMLKHIPSHFESVLHVCKLCGKVFNHRYRLLQHSKIHSDLRAHKCTVCNKGFMKASMLQEHMNMHTGAKPYKCFECSKTFANYPNCLKHMRRMHNIKKQDIRKEKLNQPMKPPELPSPNTPIDNHDPKVTIISEMLSEDPCTESDDSTMGSLDPMDLQKEWCISNESPIIDNSLQYTDMLPVKNTFDFEVSNNEGTVLPYSDAEGGGAVLREYGPEFKDPLHTPLQRPPAWEPLITKVCRVCLALDVKMYALRDTELKTMFQNITGITVNENNHSILGNVCWECAARLKTAATFRNKALLSDSLLQDLINTRVQIQKNDITTLKEKADDLITATTLTSIKAFHTVDIEDQNITQSDDNSNQLSELNVIKNSINKEIKENNAVRDNEIENNSIIEEENIAMTVKEDESNVTIPKPIKTEIEDDPTSNNTVEKVRVENTVMDDKIENSIIEEDNAVMDVEESEINVPNKTEIEDDPTCFNTGKKIREENTVMNVKIENSIINEENTVTDAEEDEFNVPTKTMIEDNTTFSNTAAKIKEENNQDNTFYSENTITSYPVLDRDILLETTIKIQDEDPIMYVFY